ncbi:MAG TPA: YdcF family protein [Candidatus Acidoferrales bacterium]|nr:YdcF family protein [Candidatus Acidoferrales bacterium]
MKPPSRRFSGSAQRGGIISTFVALLFLGVFCFAVYLVRHPLMRAAANWWIVEDPLQRSGALIVLGDDNFYGDRATRAAEIFREGKAPIIIVSGRRLRPNAGVAELMEHDLVERGIPKQAIVRFTHDADSTAEEATELATFVRQRNIHSIILVTSNYHTRRARYIFRCIFPQDIEVRVASARDGDFNPDQWWEKRKSVKQLAREWTAYVVARWELRGRKDVQDATQSVVGASP